MSEQSHTHPQKVANIQELISLATSGALEDVLYIGDKKYRSDFLFKTKKEAQKLIESDKNILTPSGQEGELFVYNERTHEIVPFHKNNYLMYDRGYFTFDGEQYISCDDNGTPIQKIAY